MIEGQRGVKERTAYDVVEVLVLDVLDVGSHSEERVGVRRTGGAQKQEGMTGGRRRYVGRVFML